jgi:1-acyl-sn-glycerol-3-phosphate acyltransferase
MQLLLVIPRTLWKLVFLLNFVVGLVVLYPFFYLLLLNKKWYPIVFVLKRFWAKWILIVPGIWLEVQDENKSTTMPHPCVYCANHSSYLDIVVSYVIVNQFFVFMGKQELSKAPLFNVFFKDMNILVDRKSRTSSHRAFMRAGVEIDKGNSVFLFPEGGISNSGRLRGFKNGAFKLAIEKQVPIVPICFLNNFKILQNGGFFKSRGCPGVSKVIIHSPIETKGMNENDLLHLRSKIHSIIHNDLKEEKNEN